MTEEQNKLAEEIELSLDLNSSPRLSLNQWKQIIAALRREPATDAVLRDALERLLNSYRLLLAQKPVRDVSETIAEAERALKGKGASQGVEGET